MESEEPKKDIEINTRELPNAMKDLIVQSTCEQSSKFLIATMEMLGIENFIECTVVDAKTGNRFTMSFRKIVDPVTP